MKPMDDADLLRELTRTAEHIYGKVVGRLGGFTDAFMGPCGDSFCYASCDMATCRSEYRLGPTPKEHNLALELKAKQDPNYHALQILIKKTKANLNITCTHQRVEIRQWEWDDGYGTQKKLPYHKCEDCGKVNNWPGSSNLWHKEE